MKYRSRTDIAYEILQAANGGGTKTKIMYKAFISYAQLKEHLTMMLANDLLEFDEKTQIYKTTEKGLSFAKLYDQVGQYVSPVQKKMMQLMTCKTIEGTSQFGAFTAI